MVKKGLLLILAVFFIAGTDAFITDVTTYNTTKLGVSISETVDLYAYEINFDYTGASASIQQYSFLGGDASYGSSVKNNMLSVYGARMDANQVGVSGSGMLFNVSHSGAGGIELRYTLEIYANGTEVYTYYNETEPAPVTPEDGGGSGGGGGGGGGGGKPKQFSLSPELLQLTLVEGRTTREKIRLTNLGREQVQINEVDFGSLSDFIAAYVPRTPFYLPSGGSVELNVDFFARKGVSPEAYTGEIKFKTSESTELLPTVVQVVEEQPLFDVIVSLERDEYAPGDIALGTVDIQNFGDKTNIDVIVHYAIKNFAGETLVFEEGSYAIENYKLHLVTKLRVPRDVEAGEKLIYYVKVTYPQQDIYATASSAFTVVQPFFSPGFSMSLFFLILIPIAIVAIIIVTVVIIFNVTRKEKKEEPTVQNDFNNN